MTTPSSAYLALIAGLCSAALISRFRRAIISGGVCFGAPTPAQPLVDEPWCINIGRLEANVISAFHAKGLEAPRQIVTTNSNQLKHALVATGQFLSVTSASRLRLSNKRLGLRPLKVDIAIPPSRVGLVTLRGRTISPAAQLFIDSARKLTRPFANKDQ